MANNKRFSLDNRAAAGFAITAVALALTALLAGCSDSYGPFTKQTLQLCGEDVKNSRLLATDLTGDGKDNLAVSCAPRDDEGASYVEIWQSNDKGRFKQIQRWNLDATHDWSFAGQMTAADINEDGRPDLMVLDAEDGDTGISFVYSRADGGWDKPRYMKERHFDWNGWVAAADVNGDGHQDVILATDGLRAWYKDGNGNPLKTLRFRTNMKSDDRRASLTKAHLDRDGRIDGVFASPARHRLTLYHSGRAAERVELDKSWPDYPRVKTGGRFDGDDKTDLLYYTIDDDGHAEANLLLSQGGIHKSKILPIPLDKFDEFEANAAHINGDDRLDLIVRLKTTHKPDQLLLLTGKADGRFEKAAALELPGSAYMDAMGDFNADGKVDLIYPLRSGERVAYMSGS